MGRQLLLRVKFWILGVCVIIGTEPPTCDPAPASVVIGSVLHAWWLYDSTEKEVTSNMESCNLNLTFISTQIDTGNQFLLRQAVSSSFKTNGADLVVIGYSPAVCSYSKVDVNNDDDAQLILPCPVTTLSVSDSPTFLPRSTCAMVWEFLSQYVSSIPQTTLVVIYDETAGTFVNKLLQELHITNTSLKLMVYSTPDFQPGTRGRLFLKQLHDRLYVKGIYGLFFGTETSLTTFLKEIDEFDTLNPRTTDFRHRSYWLAVSNIRNTHSISPVSKHLENLAVISPGLPTYHYDRKIPVSKILSNNIFAAVMKITEKENVTRGQIVDHIKQSLKSLFQMSDLNRLYMYSAQGIDSTRHFTKRYLSLYPCNILDLLFPNMKYGYNRRHLNITIQPWPGFMERVSENGVVSYKGMCMEILRVMQEALNFTYTLYENKDKTWGTEENGSWIGMVGELQRREADLALADVTIHYQRDQVVDFVLPAFRTEVTDIVYRRFSKDEFSLKTVTRPFHPLVVLCIASSLLFVLFLVVITETVNPYYSKPRATPRTVMGSLWHTMWYLLGAILSQGGTTEPSSSTGRILVATWWLFCIVVSATYSATLIVSFAVEDDTLPFTSLAELVDNDEYRWGMFDGSISMLILTNSTRPEFQKAIGGVRRFAQIDPSVLSTDIEVQLRKVQTEKYALISSRATLEYMQSVSAPLGMDLQIVGDSLYSTHVALAVVSDSALMPDFERVMSTIYEIGLLDTWERQWWNRSVPSPSSVTLGGKPVTTHNFLNALCFIAMGVIAAVMALVLEHVVSVVRHKLSQKSNTQQINK